MKRSLFLALALFPLSAQSAPAPGAVCFDPVKPCHSAFKKFAPYELPFVLPAKIKDNTPYKSAPFYAVVLKSRASGATTDCDAGEYTRALERERLAMQAVFKGRKVFADQQCPDMGAVSYELDGHSNTRVTLAVYAGKTSREAQSVLQIARRRYRGAKIQRARVVFERIMQ